MRVGALCYGALAAVAVLGGAGCGGGNKPVKVEGVVTLDGKPLERATVTFLPEGEAGQLATGLTGSDGSFRLTTLRFGDGARPGDYKVMITVAEPVPDIEVHDGMTSQEVMAMYFKALKELRSKPKQPLPPLPAAYRDPDKTPLKEKVPPDGKVILDLRSSGS